MGTDHPDAKAQSLQPLELKARRHPATHRAGKASLLLPFSQEKKTVVVA